jgi:maleate isomerase
MAMFDQIRWRARIGLITTSGQLITEPRYYQLAPRGVTFHATRMLNPGGGLDGIREMERESWRGVSELATARVSSIAYCCTVSGALRGLDGDKAFCGQVQDRYGIPTTSTMLAAAEALQHMGASRIAVATPYTEGHHESERAYLERAGIHPIVMRGMGLTGGEQFSAVPPAEIYDFCLETWDESADALFISCMNFDAIAVTGALEERLGKPVVTSHTATLWRALALADIGDPIMGWGRLLAEPRLAAVP